MVVDVDGALYIDDRETSLRAAVDEVGLVCSLVDHVKSYLDSDALVRLSDGWCAPFSELCLHYHCV